MGFKMTPLRRTTPLSTYAWIELALTKKRQGRGLQENINYYSLTELAHAVPWKKGLFSVKENSFFFFFSFSIQEKQQSFGGWLWGFAPSQQLCCTRPEWLFCNCLATDHFFLLLHIHALDSLPCGKAISLSSSSTAGEGWTEEARREARLPKRSKSLSPNYSQTTRTPGRACFFSFEQLSHKKRTENPAGWQTQPGFTQCSHSSSTSAVSIEQCGQRRWSESFQRKSECMGENRWTRKPSSDGATYGAVVFSMFCMEQWSRELPRLHCHQSTELWWQWCPGTTRDSCWSRIGNPAQAMLLLKYSWQLQARGHWGRLPQV